MKDHWENDEKMMRENTREPVVSFLILPGVRDVLCSTHPESVLAAVSDVQKSVFVHVIVVNLRDYSRRWREDVSNEHKDGFVRAKLDSLPDHVHELAYGEVVRHEILLFVDVRHVCLRIFSFFDDDGNTVGVFFFDSRRLGLTPVQGVLAFEP